MSKMSRITTGLALTSALGLVLAGCSGGDGGGGSDGEKGDLKIAVFNGWEEGIAVSELWKHILEDKGYNVDLEYADAAPVFSGLASGDYDMTLDVWMPVTHASYIEKYGDSIEEYGAWNDESKLTIAVNDDAPIQSLSELADNADAFDNQLVGIEPGAGLTEVTQNEVIPKYGLEGMEYTTSSTPAMLQELQTAEDSGENIAVTLWRPHWAYEAYDIRDLEDPEGALGGTETLSAYGRDGFESDHSEVAGWLKDFRMDSDTLYSLENVMFNESDSDDYAPIVEDWVSENQEYVDSLTSDDEGDSDSSSEQPSGTEESSES
jgi:glycine betaine/proline transport system substrate-binding protein